MANQQKQIHCVHRHSSADLIVTIAKRLPQVMQHYTTPQGLRDAQECMEDGVAENADIADEVQVLLNKLFLILKDVEVPNGQQC